MLRSSLIVLSSVFFIVLASCGRTDKSALNIPKDAGLVLHINTSSLSSKLSWKEIQQTNWFKEAYSGANDSLAKKLLDNPENSGVDSKGDLLFFIKRQGKGGYFAFEGLLKDPAAFEAFNKKMKPTATGSKSGDLNILKIDEGIATWKDGRFIYLYDAPMAALSSYPGGSMEDAKLPADSLILIAKKLYDLDGDATLGSDAHYTALLKEQGDVHIWFNMGNLYGGMVNGMLSMMKLSTLLEGNVSAATLNFENGKIDIKSKSYYNKELTKLYEKFKMKDIDDDMLARIPSNNVVGAFAMNFQPEGFKEFIKVLGVDGMANSFLSEVGYSMDEFVKANKGDLLVALSDFEVKPKEITVPPYEEGGKPYTYTQKEPSVKFLFALSVKDKPAFDKLVGVLNAKIGTHLASSGISYALNDKWFAIGNSEEQVNKFLAGGFNNKQAFVSKLSGNSAGIYVDIRKLLQGTELATTDSSAKVALAESIKTWEDIVAIGNMKGGNSADGRCEINLVDKSTNSLKQINQYVDKMAAAKKMKMSH